ncbi:MAG: hypothetical protein IID51_07055 [Proteobacteria bacterium]|nr:hypothetical protein [Pseudomonadota bacterium]
MARLDIVFAFITLLVLSGPAQAQSEGAVDPNTGAEKEAEQQASGPMTLERLDAMIRRVDEGAERQGNVWQFKVEGVSVSVITDPNADRMRILAGVIEVDKLQPDSLMRLLQANFDTALDARYAIAQNILWGTFIHPLGALDDAEFLSGLGQAVNLVFTFGTSYSSGLFSFGGGDSNAILRRELIDRLLEDGQPT